MNMEEQPILSQEAPKPQIVRTDGLPCIELDCSVEDTSTGKLWKIRAHGSSTTVQDSAALFDHCLERFFQLKALCEKESVKPK